MTEAENIVNINPPSNFVFGETIESDIDFSTAGFNVISDNDLFKYFLNEDFVDPSEQLLLSPASSLDSSAPNSSDSPQSSPPQPSPERHEFGAPLVSIPSVPTFNQVKIKEEVSDSNLRNTKKRAAPSSKETEELLKVTKVISEPNNTTSTRPPEAEKQLKRQKRLIKNRESAQLSRLRKKLYIEELEKKVNHLTTDNDSLSKQVNGLNSDKKRLQDEVIYLQNIIKQSPELSAVLATRKSGFQPKNMKAAGVCLLIILFSVGLIFNQSKSSLPFARLSREEIPEVIPKSALYTGRALKSAPEVVEEFDEPILSVEKSTPKIVEIKENELTALSPLKIKEISKERKHKRDEDEDQIIIINKPQVKQIESSKKKRMKISEESPIEEVSTKALVTTENQNTEIIPRMNPNANYIYCPEAHYISPASASSDGPEIVALLLPASVLNGTLYGNQNNLDSSLLEVSCQILNLHMWPLNNNTVPQR